MISKLTTPLAHSLELPCGLVLPNRLVKASVSEGLGTTEGGVSDRLLTLYDWWAESGAGTLITGNVMVDGRYREHRQNVIVDAAISREQRKQLGDWASHAKVSGARVILQLSHPGALGRVEGARRAVAPSAMQHAARRLSVFPRTSPRALTEDEIKSIISAFVRAAEVAEGVGFDGVEIQGGQGFLISQFLSPLNNRRTDQWGGSLENRCRLLIEIVQNIRKTVSPTFALGVALSVSEFEPGGFGFEDCLEVVDWLNQEKVDFLEFNGSDHIERTHRPDSEHIAANRLNFEGGGYVIEYARAVKDRALMPIMLTGGLRHKAGMETALDHQRADLLGLGRPFCEQPHLGHQLLRARPDFSFGPDIQAPRGVSNTGLMKTLQRHADHKAVHKRLQALTESKYRLSDHSR